MRPAWRHVCGLRDHPSRPMAAGRRRADPAYPRPSPDDGRQLWVGISAVGVFHTRRWRRELEPRNRGTRCGLFCPRGSVIRNLASACIASSGRRASQSGCISKTIAACTAATMAGGAGVSIEAGLPSTFGFPAAAHPRDPETLWLLPLNGDTAGRYVPDGKAAVWRTRDGGENWQALREGCRRRMPFSACCARPWRRTSLSRRAFISAPTPARSSPAPTRAKAGARSRSICRPSPRSKRWSSMLER